MTKKFGKMGSNSRYFGFNRVSNIYKKVIEAVTHIFTASERDVFVRNILRNSIGLFRNVDNNLAKSCRLSIVIFWSRPRLGEILDLR